MMSSYRSVVCDPWVFDLGVGLDTKVDIRNISCAQMHINISITVAGNGAYNNFCNVLKFKSFMEGCMDPISLLSALYRIRFF